MATGDGFELNFENTPIASVAKVVLGDILGVGYVIDQRVQGNISLSSGRPIPKSDVLFALESALRIPGIALVRDNAAYRLMPQADAVGTSAADAAERTEAGYGISVVPLHYVSAQMLLKLVDNFGTKAGMLRADTTRNLILVQGTGDERRNAVGLLLSFDADWMRGQSVGIFPVQNSNPEPIIAELEKIIDSGEGGLAQNTVRFQAIGRMNAVLAVTHKPELLRRIETWINRLDNTNAARSAIHVYHAKYAEARQIARVLNDIFGGGGTGSSSTLDSASGQIAPGSGLSSSSSGGSALNRLSAGQSSQTSGQTAGGSGISAGTANSGAAQAGYGAASNTPQGGSLFDNSGGGQFGARGGGATGGGGLLEGVRITADTVHNTLLIYASQEQYSLIERTVRQIDQPQLQVAIDATIAEVTLTDDLQFGVQSYITSHDLGLKPDTGSLSNSASSALISAAGNVVLNRALPGLNFLVGSGTTPKGILSALHAVTDVKVLSNPSLVVIDNQVATLQVGDEIPIQTGSATVLSGNNTVASTTDYRSTGIILRVVPRINANGNVRLEIEQEISNPVTNSTNSTTTTNSLTPTVSTRKVRSSVAVASGQTVLLAGLVSDSQNRTRSGIPVLDQIPGLGDVFSQTDKTIKRTELIIFIRPQIIRDGTDAHFVAEEVRTKLRGTIGAIESRQAAPTKYR
jgi:general secretion pathway protein D